MTETMGAYAGLFGGMILGLLGLFLGNYFLKKKRGLDERHDMMRTKARAASWFFPLAATYVFFVLHLLNVIISIPFMLAMLILVQMGSWACFILYYHYKH
ncbi:hypothetical protein [Brevibacillus borstelensis]|uniref:hypothetical protein n=1 Tax=Brevibacillus borstelensis TaxID=45462 RepID=UPI0030BDF9C3